MFQWLIDFFEWFGSIWTTIFGWVSEFFNGIGNLINSLFEGKEFIGGILQGTGFYLPIVEALALCIGLTVVLKVLNR